MTIFSREYVVNTPLITNIWTHNLQCFLNPRTTEMDQDQNVRMFCHNDKQRLVAMNVK